MYSLYKHQYVINNTFDIVWYILEAKAADKNQFSIQLPYCLYIEIYT